MRLRFAASRDDLGKSNHLHMDPNRAIGPKRLFHPFGSEARNATDLVLDQGVRVSTDLDEERHRLIMTFRGSVCLSDILEMTRVSRAAAILHYPLLVDMRAANLSLGEDDFEGVRAMALRLAADSPLGPTAVLLGNENDLPAVERVSKEIAKFCDVRGFLDEEEARRWLKWE